VPKRRFQRGTFVKRGDNWVGMWRVDVIQADGSIKREQRSKTFVGLSERGARATFQPFLDAVNAANGATPPIPRGAMSLNGLIREWREQIAGHLKPSSGKAAESHLRAHIVQALGACTLPELTAKRLQMFVTALSDGSRTRKTIENILLTLSSILSVGRDWGYPVPKVSLSDLTLPQEHPRSVRCYSLEEMQKIIRFADEPLATICFLLAATGMRIGEALALHVQDADYHQKLVRVRWSAWYGKIQTPKSKASIADLPMPEALETRLREYMASSSYRQNGLGLLFTNRRGRPYSANNLQERKLRPLLAKLGMAAGGFHAFRHAVATELIDGGAPVTVVQAQLRHSDPRITLGLYSHVIPKSQRDAVSRLAEQLLTQPRIADSAA
jgi:integrase